MIDEIQIILFFCCIIALVLVILNGRRRELKDISKMNKEKLKQEAVKVFYSNITIGERERKSLIIFGVVILIVLLMQILKPLDRIKWIIGFVMTISAIVWMIFDIVQIKNPNNKAVVLAYIQSTFTNPRHKNRTAEIIYYDYKKNKFRLKTISIDRYEERYGRLRKNDFVDVIVVEGMKRVKYMCLAEDNNESF